MTKSSKTKRTVRKARVSRFVETRKSYFEKNTGLWSFIAVLISAAALLVTCYFSYESNEAVQQQLVLARQQATQNNPQFVYDSSRTVRLKNSQNMITAYLSLKGLGSVSVSYSTIIVINILSGFKRSFTLQGPFFVSAGGIWPVPLKGKLLLDSIIQNTNTYVYINVKYKDNSFDRSDIYKTVLTWEKNLEDSSQMLLI